MSLPEIIPSNLPIFVQNKDRTAFANSVIPSGSVLLFAESDGNGGSKLIAKNPDGSFSEVGGGGGGGSMNFYKCASVNSDSTWAGYKATLADGVYSFESDITNNLIYTNVTPKIGRVYSTDCLVEASLYLGIPTEGLVFYHKCNTISSNDECGHALTYNQGNIAIESDSSLGKDGNKILNLQSGTVAADLGSYYASSADWTISAWMKESVAANPYYNICLISSVQHYYRCEMSGFYDVINYSVQYSVLSEATITNWNHYTYVKSDATLYLYLNGALVGTAVMSSGMIPNNIRYISLGSNDRTATRMDGTAKYGNIRMYNRALSSSEILSLANEFTPTPAS